MIRSFCRQPGCKAIAQRGVYCDTHRPKDDERPNFRQRGYTAEWDKLSKTHRELEPFCSRCGRLAQQVHHLEKVSTTGQVIVDHDKLSSLCPSCHSKLTKAGQ